MNRSWPSCSSKATTVVCPGDARYPLDERIHVRGLTHFTPSPAP